MRSLLNALITFYVSVLAVGSHASERQVLRGHLPRAAARLQSLGQLAATNRMHLAIGLPLHNQAGLTYLLRQIYDPQSALFRQYLTPEQFTKAFSPSEAEYQAVIGFARSNGLAVTGTHFNRMLVDVEASAADVERAFLVKLLMYPHPQQARSFFAPDSEPSIEQGIRVAHISGLDNYTVPQPRSHRRPSGGIARSGSGPGGSYFGNDFRSAYIPGLSLTGTGQTVGLLEFDGYFTNDIAAYESQTGLPGVPLKNVLVDGFNGIPGSSSPGSNNEEVALDIEVAISMAPGLAQVRIYEASPSATTANLDDMLNLMATENAAKQLSCSWGFDIDNTSQQIFQQFAAQGQSFFLASGDSGAFSGFVDQPADDPFITVVGGTTLSTDSSHHWLAETTWDGSGGGISSIYSIPDWQQGINMSLNHGSTTLRNVPDVAMISDNAWEVADNGQSFAVVGTSIATPLWASFTALANQQAAAQAKPPVGFFNPALYSVARSAAYATCFHDITSGNNTSSASPNLFFAAPGYDLCTGWGSLNGGTNLINALLARPTEALLITPPLAFTSQGPIGGPFTVTTETYTLTNAGNVALSWSLSNTSTWLNVSRNQGTILPGGPSSNVTVTVNSSGSNFLLGNYIATIFFTNLNDGVVQNRQFALLVGNAGFETGDFTDWNFAADNGNNFIDSVDGTDLFGSPTIPGVNDSLFVHSGIYGAFLGQTGSLGFISQTLPTTSGQRYKLSFWLDNPATGTPNEFNASWNGTTLFDGVNLGKFAWTNMQFVVSATQSSTILQFGFLNDLNAFGLDDVTVQTIPAPVLQLVSRSNGITSLAWSAVPGIIYQPQSTDDLKTAAWTSLGNPITATTTTLTATDPAASSPQRFYRIMLP